jgi:hypothetical protein
MTREEWLTTMAHSLEADFQRAGYPLPARLRISCGWPSNRPLAGASGKRSAAECWPAEASADAHVEIFVSPYRADAADVAGDLVHELCHAADGNKHGHKGPFRAIALAVGLTGKMTSTETGPKLGERLNALIAQIGPYPHATLDRSGRKRQSTRMLKVVCPECGYTVRTTDKWITQGLPTCPCGEEMQEE